MKHADEVSSNMEAVAGVAGVPAAIWREAQAAGLLRADIPFP